MIAVRVQWWGIARYAVGCGFAAVFLIALVWLGQASSQLDSQRDQIANQNTTIANLSSSLATTEQQLRAHGITPSAPPPEQIMQGTSVMTYATAPVVRLARWGGV
jgi:hypothetical protein